MTFPILFVFLSFGNLKIADTSKQPAVSIEETVITPLSLLEIRDTADSAGAIGRVLGRDYGDLYQFVQKNGMTPGKAMAFYYSAQAPFILDAAVEVDRFVGAPTGRIRMERNDGGKAVVVHYQGPYEQVEIAHRELGRWLARSRREPKGPPFEVYLNSPMNVGDPSDLRTDVCQLLK